MLWKFLPSISLLVWLIDFINKILELVDRVLQLVSNLSYGAAAMTDELECKKPLTFINGIICINLLLLS